MDPFSGSNGHPLDPMDPLDILDPLDTLDPLDIHWMKKWNHLMDESGSIGNHWIHFNGPNGSNVQFNSRQSAI